MGLGHVHKGLGGLHVHKGLGGLHVPKGLGSVQVVVIEAGVTEPNGTQGGAVALPRMTQHCTLEETTGLGPHVEAEPGSLVPRPATEAVGDGLAVEALEGEAELAWKHSHVHLSSSFWQFFGQGGVCVELPSLPAPMATRPSFFVGLPVCSM